MKYAIFAILTTIYRVVFSAEIAIITNINTPIKIISQVSIANLFLIPGANWPDGTPVKPFDLRNPSATKAGFYSQVTGVSLTQLRAYWARHIFSGTGDPPIEVDTPQELLNRIAHTPGSIGYLPKESVDNSVRILFVLP